LTAFDISLEKRYEFEGYERSRDGSGEVYFGLPISVKEEDWVGGELKRKIGLVKSGLEWVLKDGRCMLEFHGGLIEG
jgi:hypothetical protein